MLLFESPESVLLKLFCLRDFIFHKGLQKEILILVWLALCSWHCFVHKIICTQVVSLSNAPTNFTYFIIDKIRVSRKIKILFDMRPHSGKLLIVSF